MDVFLAARIKALRTEADTLEKVLDEYLLKKRGVPLPSPAMPRADSGGLGKARETVDRLLPHRHEFGDFIAPDHSGGGRPIARGSNSWRTLEWLHWAGPNGLTIDNLYDLHFAHGYDNQAGVRNVIFKQGKQGRIVKKGNAYVAAVHAPQT